ncbi:Ig-like domain-containing protein [Actinomyces slackii]|nr:Ig-like domain-containing protein [Actinomyces slackii]
MRRRLSTAAAALTVMALATAAWLHDGVAQADLHLHDGGVWVTSTSDHLVARLNYPSREVDGAIRTASATFDVTQDAENVLVPDSADATVSTVDPSQVAFTERTQLTQGLSVQQGADRVLAADASEGTIRATTVATVSALSASTPLVTGMPDVVAVAGKDGAIHAVSATTGSRLSLPVKDAGWDSAVTADLPLTAGTDVAITAVGERPVVLERGTGILHLSNGQKVNLSEPGLTLQQPGPAADSVLVASRTALISVSLEDGSVSRIPAASGTVPEGVAAQPVRLGRCIYGAWSGSGQFVRECTGLGGGNETLHNESLASSSTPIFRVNRDAIVLNDVETGKVWLPDEELILIDDWTDVTAQTDDSSDVEDDSANISEEQTPPERTEENHAPEANDDAFGVRPGRATLLPVLANDSDPDGDVLTASATEAGSVASVTSAQGGLALHLDVPADATGTITVPYTASDGRGMSDSATATVEVHGWDVNAAPEQTTTPTLSLTEGAVGSVSVLGHWLDPDGDNVYLVSAQGEGLDVKSSHEGTVTVREMGAGTGTREMTVVVSDGQETATGTVKVDVQSADTAKPIPNADHIRVVAGSRVVVSPLDNDVSPTGAPLHLAGVQEAPAGTTVEVDQQAGVFTFSAEAAQTLYLTYDVLDGANTAQGLVRIDVVERTDPSVPPEVEDDTALLRDGGATTIAPLSNDFDPSGGILVLQSVSAPPESGVTVTVVDHSLLQISTSGTVPPSTSVEYTVTNGTATTTGRVSIVPVTSSQSQPPVVGDDTAVVRAGDVVTVPVLDNDSSPAGLTLSVANELGLAGPELGTAWVSDDTVRFRAGEEAGRTTLSYTATDSHGQTASGAVTIEVRPRDDANNAAPSPQGLEARTVAGSEATIGVPLDGIDPDGDSVSLVGMEQAPEMGTVEVSSTWLTYTPLEGATGTDTFTYVVEDRFGSQSTATVRVGVASAPSTNAAPVATDDLVVARPGRTVAVDVLSNDLDADGDTLSLEGSPTSSDPALTVSTRAGRVVLTLPGQEGVYAVTYTVADGRGGTDTGTLTVQVAQDAPLVNPVGVDDYVTVDQVDANGRVTIPVLDNDQDADGSPWDLEVSVTDADVQVEGDSLSMTVGEERRVVLYTITDADGLTGNAVVVVPARSELRPRVNAATVPIKVPSDTSTDIPLSAHIVSRAGTSPVITDADTIRTGAGTQGAALSGDGTSLRYTPSQGFIGQSSVTFTVADGTGSDALSSTVTLPIEVVSTTNTPPVFTPTEVVAAPGEEATTVSLAAMTTDPDQGDTLTYSAGSAPAGFEVSLSGSTLSVSAAEGTAEGATGTVDITVNDGTSDPVTAALPLRAGPSNRPLMTAAPTTIDSDGSPVSVDVATLVTNPFPDKPITLSGEPRVTGGEGSVTVSGTTLTISPASGFNGRMTVSYTALDATGSASRAVTGTVTVTVKGVPGAPTGVRAQAAGASAMTVSWAAGPDNGSPITRYTVSEVGGAGRWVCSGSPCRADGLTPGKSYSFQVVATNAVGDSPPSAASSPEVFNVKADTPGAPTLTAGQGQITASWSPVASIEGVSMTYEVRLSDGSTHTTSGTSLTVRSVSNGTTYTASVRAIPSAGQPSDFSNRSNPATPIGPPSAPGQPQATSSGDQVRVSWTPAPGNGSTVRYTVQVSGAASRSVDAGTSTSVSVSLPPGSYSFTVTATNDAGQATSPSTSFTHKTVPLAPSNPTARATGESGVIEVSASPRSGNGYSEGELSIQYSVDGANWTSSTTITGLTDGRSYTVRAKAVSQDGRESEAVSGASATPYTETPPPSRPSKPSINCSVDGLQVTCSWAPGGQDSEGTTYQQRWRAEDDDDWTYDSIRQGQSISFEGDDDDTATACVRARHREAGDSEWACQDIEVDDGIHQAQGRVAVGTSVSFPLSTDAAEAVCTERDLRETGFSPDSCWRIVIDISGMNPSSTVSCSYTYLNRRFGQQSTHLQQVSLDSNGQAHAVFPHRSPSPNNQVTCTQR